MAIAAILAGCSASRPVTTDDGSRHILRSGDLVAQVMTPGHPQRYNRGVRFTPVAAVLSASLRGREFLYNPQAHDFIEDHGGLAAEFDMVAPDDPEEWMPPGYQEAKPGEGFLKIGVGVLQKQARRYSLFQQPRLLIPAQTTVEWTADSARFAQVCPGVGGYAYALGADLQVKGSDLSVTWTLTNTGVRPLVTRQYIHNFIRFGQYEVGPDYLLSFPYDISAAGLQPQQRQIGRTIEFRERIPQWVNLLAPYPAHYRGRNILTLTHAPAGQSLTMETSMPSLRTAIHARPAYLSPEQFIEIRLAPGQSRSWVRRYHFALTPAL